MTKNSMCSAGGEWAAGERGPRAITHGWIAHGLIALSVLALTLTGLTLTACGGDESVLFGAVLPLTGEDALYGVPVRNGVELAHQKIQQRGELSYAIELEIEDSASESAQARDKLTALYGQGALAVIGGVTSAEALEMVDVADQVDRILLSPSASSPRLTSISKNFYRVFPSDLLEGSRMGNFATQTLGLKTVVIVAAESIYGRGIQEVFKTEFERFGGQVLEVVEYPENTSDFSGLAARVVTLNPQAVYLADFADSVSRMVEELRDRNYRGEILTTSAFASPAVLQRLGDASQSIMLTQPMFDPDSEDEYIQEFVADYTAAYGEPPGLYAAHGYDAMMVLAAALARAARPNSNEFWKGMRGVRDLPGVTGTLSFDERGDVQKFPRVYIVNDGSLVDHDAYVAERRKELRDAMERLNREANQLRRQEAAQPPG